MAIMTAQEVAMKMTLVRPDADRRCSLSERMEASFMREIALLKVRTPCMRGSVTYRQVLRR